LSINRNQQAAAPVPSPAERDRRFGGAVQMPDPPNPGPRPGDRMDGTRYVDPRAVAVPAVVPPPVPQPAYPDPKNYAWVYDASSALPPMAEPGVLAVLVESRGHSAFDDCLGAIRQIDHLLKDAQAIDDETARVRAKDVWGSNLSGVIPGFARVRPDPTPAADDLTARRGVYFARVVALAKLLEVEPPVCLDPRIRSSAGARAELGRAEAAIADRARLAGSQDAYGRSGVRPESMPEIDGLIIGLANRRAAMAPKPLKQWESRQSRGPDYPATRDVFPQDLLIADLNASVRRKAELAHQAEALEALELARDRAAAELVASTAARVEGAVEAAGGVGAITSAIVAALTLGEPPQAADPEPARIAAELAALKAAGIESGPSVVSLRARHSELTARAEASAARRVAARRSRAESLLSAASAGQATAVSEIEGLAVASPAAFPAGFADALAGGGDQS
jgi:hypothetical protein